jgi:hypothetical protein
MTEWRCVHAGFEGDDLQIGGVHVWKQDWRLVEMPAPLLPHPSYRDQMHVYRVYEIGDPLRPVRFAAAELSAGAWGFYVPASAPNFSN